MPNRNDERPMRITVAGVAYTLTIGELTHEIELELYKASGLTVPEIVNASERGSGAPFMIAALVFLARRQAGDRITYDEVAQAINYRTLRDDFDLQVVDADETSSAPEAPAAD